MLVIAADGVADRRVCAADLFTPEAKMVGKLTIA
jgi:hypothetical protein